MCAAGKGTSAAGGAPSAAGGKKRQKMPQTAVEDSTIQVTDTFSLLCHCTATEDRDSRAPHSLGRCSHGGILSHEMWCRGRARFRGTLLVEVGAAYHRSINTCSHHPIRHHNRYITPLHNCSIHTKISRRHQATSCITSSSNSSSSCIIRTLPPNSTMSLQTCLIPSILLSLSRGSSTIMLRLLSHPSIHINSSRNRGSKKKRLQQPPQISSTDGSMNLEHTNCLS